ncbi:MAG TPA: hypothetical protein VM165_18420 [Planctomycetaceae bacterium]|nr:hypothetical protein [Planctomycetaceae bacterium]
MRTSSRTRQAQPSVVSVVRGRGPLGLPGLLTSTDVVIGDPAVSYVDPEFLPEERLMVWQDAAGEVWLCEVDPDTGNMVPADGKGESAGRAAPLLTKRNPFFKVTYNGPEFGVSQQGIVVYYCDSEQLEITRFDLASRRIDIPVPGVTRNTLALISSKVPGAPGTLVMYGRIGATPAGGNQILNEWFDDSEPEVVHPVPRIKSGTSGPQWFPGQRAIIAQLPDENGVEQVCRYDIDAEQFTLLTDTPGDKIDSFAFQAPEYPGEILFLTLNQRQWLEVYRQRGTRWTRILRIPAPASSAKTSSGLKSAEPVAYRGKTYITYLADSGDKMTRIALASLDGKINAWVSRAGQLDQYDPEGIVLGDKLFVYYYDGVNQQDIHALHRCRVQF